MVRHKLTDAKIKSLKKPGIYGDGGCLYLRVHQGGSRGWFFIYTLHGKRTELGLGGFDGAAPVSLALARKKAEDERKILAAGQDPKLMRDVRKASETVTFGALAKTYIEEKVTGGDHTIREWTRQLLEDCESLKKVPIVSISTELIESALRKIWKEKPATGQRIRSKLEAVIDYATAKRLRVGDNPAKWTGHLEHVLTAAGRVTGEKHAALAYQHVPSLFLDLDDDVVHRCLGFTILTAVRTTESRAAEWTEVNWEKKDWTIPAERMKGKREHVVPLSDEAIYILKLQWEASNSEYIFESVRKGKPIGNSSMRQVLPELRTGVTVHGFRSAFSDWAGEETEFNREIVEWSLAHQVGSAVERAYRRSDALEKRRELMAAWGKYCLSEVAKKKAA
ncbi:tyrosine-type recombinase/integrase [Rhizobium leguminosarum]